MPSNKVQGNCNSISDLSMPLHFRPQNNKRYQDWQGTTQTVTKYVLDFYACHVMMLPFFEPAIHHIQKSNKSKTFFSYP